MTCSEVRDAFHDRSWEDFVQQIVDFYECVSDKFTSKKERRMVFFIRIQQHRQTVERKF